MSTSTNVTQWKAIPAVCERETVFSAKVFHSEEEMVCHALDSALGPHMEEASEH